MGRTSGANRWRKVVWTDDKGADFREIILGCVSSGVFQTATLCNFATFYRVDIDRVSAIHRVNIHPVEGSNPKWLWFQILSPTFSHSKNMNKIVFSLLLGLFLSACQNTPKSAADTPLVPADPVTKGAAAAAPEAISPEAVQQVRTNLMTGVKMMEDLRKQLDALPAKVKKEKAAEIDGMYATLEGMIEKQTGMLNDLTPSTSPKENTQDSGDVIPSPEQFKEYTESAARYAQEAQAIQEAVRKMGGK